MTPDPLDADDQDGTLWWRFDDQTWIGHALAAFGGFAVWVGTYAFWLAVMQGGLDLLTAEGTAEIAARHEAMTVATVACYVWFSVAFMLGKGGPFLNLTIYPVVSLAFGPVVTSLVVTGWVAGSFSTGSTFASPTFVADVVTVLVPGLVVGGSLVAGFLVVIFYVTGTGPEWEDRHMPEAWHEHKRQFDDDSG